MKTLELEQITALQDQHEALVRTALAGSTLANLVRGAIRGCDRSNDPAGHVEAMLRQLLELAGFEAPVWNGMCPAGKHGLDFEGQDCDVCQHERGGPCGRGCRRCHAERSRRFAP